MNRYAAFISYRHTAPDAEIAKKLHTMIETFGVPAALKRANGIRKMGRVFRDQDELPLSSDLGDDIHRALEESEWLICICSPRYLASRWCLEEVRCFLSLGRRDKILTVLVEGEPEDAFPEALRFETVDGETVEREPLAADVRADSLSGALKKLKNEKLRILAPMLGVRYDDLRQRARRRKTRMIVAAAAAAFTLLAGFLGYAVFKNAEITKQNAQITAQNEQIVSQNAEITEKSAQIEQERNEALIAESKWLSKSADEALSEKDRALSLLLSLAALPTDFSNPERPIVEDALRSLRSGVLYDKGDSGYHAVKIVEAEGLETYRAVNDSLLCFSRKIDGFLTAFDLPTGEPKGLKFKLGEEPINCFFTKTGGVILVYPDRIVQPTSLTDQDGNMIYDDLSMGYVKDENGESVKDENGKLIKAQFRDSYPSFQKLVECDYSNGGSLMLCSQYPYAVLSWYQIYNHRYRNYGDVLKSLCDAVCLNNISNGAEFVVLGNPAEPAERPTVMVRIYAAALQSGAGPMYYDREDILIRYVRNDDMLAPYLISGISLNHLAASRDGSILAAYGTHNLCLWDADDAEMRFALNPEQIGKANISDVQFSPQKTALLCMRTGNGGLYLFDCTEEKITLAIRLGMKDITGFSWSPDGDKLLVTCSDGVARILSATDGSIVQELDCPFSVREASYAGEHFLLLRNGDRIQIDELKAAEEIELPLSRWISDEPIDKPGYSSGTGKRLGLSPDGSTIWVIRNNGVTLYDAETLESKTVIPLNSQDQYYVDANNVMQVEKAQGPQARLLMSKTHAYLYAEGTDCMGYVHVFDPNTGEERASFRVNYPHTYQYKEGNEIRDRSERMVFYGIALNADETLLLTNPGQTSGGTTVREDPCIFVFRTDTYEECWHIGYNGVSDKTGYGGVLPAAADWEGEFSLNGTFLEASQKVLCCYSAHRKDYSHDDYYAAFEARDALTGALDAEYKVSGKLNGFWVLADRELVVLQTQENRIFVLRADTGTELAAFDVTGRIKSAETDDAGVWIRYAGLTSASITPRVLVAYDGTVIQDPAGEPNTPVFQDGYFGPYAYHAEADGLFDPETGEQILSVNRAEYTFMLGWKDGSKVLFRSGDYLVVIRYAEPAELREIALRILDGQTLTDEQRQKYFLQ